jgi:hypothetical protein
MVRRRFKAGIGDFLLQQLDVTRHEIQRRSDLVCHVRHGLTDGGQLLSACRRFAKLQQAFVRSEDDTSREQVHDKRHKRNGDQAGHDRAGADDATQPTEARHRHADGHRSGNPIAAIDRTATIDSARWCRSRRVHRRSSHV